MNVLATDIGLYCGVKFLALMLGEVKFSVDKLCKIMVYQFPLGKDIN